MAKKNIIIVDDNKLICDFIKTILEREKKYYCIPIYSAEEARLMLEATWRIDLIILDLMLPGIKGIDYLKELKSSDKTKSIPVIVITGKGSEDDLTVCLDLGAADYCMKERSLNYKGLVHRVRKAINESDHNKIRRSIVFPPEYTKAGLNVLHTFSEILREKHSVQGCEVKILQEGLRIQMEIDVGDGDIDVIEKDLQDYGLVMCEKMEVEKYTDNKLLQLKLKNELSLAKLTIEMQKNQLEYKDSRIEKLLCILESAFKQTPQFNPNIKVISVSESKTEQHFDLGGSLAHLQLEIKKLKERVNGNPYEQQYLEDIQENIDNIDKYSDKAVVSKSPAMSKLNNFLMAANDVDSTTRKILKKVKDGIEVIQKLAHYYNGIAKWCGLAIIPEPFLGRQTDNKKQEIAL